QVIVHKGELERLKDGTLTIDRKVLTDSLAAARELTSRKDQVGTTPEIIDNAALLIPFFLDKLGQEVEAAAAFLDYAESHQLTNTKNAQIAMDNALALIGKLRKTASEDAGTRKLNDRV